MEFSFADTKKYQDWTKKLNEYYQWALSQKRKPMMIAFIGMTGTGKSSAMIQGLINKKKDQSEVSKDI